MQKKLLISTILVGILILGFLISLFAGNPGHSAPAMPEIPPYGGLAYVELGNNIPEFTDKEKKAEPYEFYSELDALNRCGFAMACIDRSLMPSEERGSIGQVKPSGWQTVKYDFVDGKYLYNRCHLIGYQLTGENANPQNLITGTRYLNMEGMLPFENMVADYVKETGNRVLYRVTPDFRGEELLARGVRMEAWSVEDQGAGICFHVYVYNAQPGVIIDYKTGESRLDEAAVSENTQPAVSYILNTATKRFHTAQCGQGMNTKQENREVFTGSREQLLAEGYTPAGCCDP